MFAVCRGRRVCLRGRLLRTAPEVTAIALALFTITFFDYYDTHHVLRAADWHCPCLDSLDPFPFPAPKWFAPFTLSAMQLTCCTERLTAGRSHLMLVSCPFAGLQASGVRPAGNLQPATHPGLAAGTAPGAVAGGAGGRGGGAPVDRCHGGAVSRRADGGAGLPTCQTTATEIPHRDGVSPEV